MKDLEERKEALSEKLIATTKEMEDTNEQFELLLSQFQQRQDKLSQKMVVLSETENKLKNKIELLTELIENQA